MLYRVFPYDPAARSGEPGGALYVAREAQGTGRHDNPERYGALYVSRSPESAVAERIQGFRGQQIGDRDLRRSDGTRFSIAALDDSNLPEIVDLDDPSELATRVLRPSEVATRRRSRTQPIALGIFEEGLSGFGWWSTLEASWANVTLFAERARPALAVAADPEPLTTTHPVVRAAAERLGVRLGR